MSPDAAADTPDPARAGRRWWVKLLLAVVPLVLLLALLEAVLWMLGLGDGTGPTVSRGFDPETAYFAPDGDGWRTRLYDGSDERELRVPPKGEQRRVVLVGGSNTEVFPDGDLERLLDEGAPGAGYEVLNVGRAGYGSGRVAILLEQALVLEPDVVVIYSGHNEFVERGLARELERSLGGDAERAAASQLSRLRLFRQLEEALRSEPRESVGADVDPTLDPDAALEPVDEVFDAYGRNLERMVTACREAGVQVVLCTVVSNLLSPPYVSAEPADPALAQRVASLRERALGRVPKRFLEGLEPPVRLRMPSWTAGDHGPLPGELPTLRPLLGPLAETPAFPGERHDDASMEGRHWPPPAGWSRPAAVVLRTMQALVDRDLAPAERAALQTAGRTLDQALELAPDHAGVLFERGLVAWLLGEDDGAARALLARAAAADRSPHSGNDLSNAKVREVAAAHGGVVLLDAAKLFAERCPDGLVGYEVMMDACHMHPGARRVLMADIAQAILAAADD